MVCIFFVHGKSFWLINPGWMYTVQKKNFIHSPLKISTFFRYDESLAHESQSPRCTSPRACLFSLYMVDFSSKSYKQYAFQKQIVRVHQFTPQSSNPQATIPHQVTTLLHATLTSHTLRLAFKDPKLKQTGQNVTSNTQPSRTCLQHGWCYSNVCAFFLYLYSSKRKKECARMVSRFVRQKPKTNFTSCSNPTRLATKAPREKKSSLSGTSSHSQRNELPFSPPRRLMMDPCPT